MPPRLSSTDSDTWSDSVGGEVDDALSEFFTFSTPLSFDSSRLLRNCGSTDSIPDLSLDEECSGTDQRKDSPRWIPLSIDSTETSLPWGISVPEPPCTGNGREEFDTSSQGSVEPFFSYTRRPAEYVPRPPVWSVKPLSSPVSDSDTNSMSSSELSDHFSVCQFCSPGRARNSLNKEPMSNCRTLIGSRVSSLESKGFLDGYGKQMNSMASVWSEEPFIIAMASIPDFDLEWMRNNEASNTQSKGKEKAVDDSRYHSSSTNSDSPLLGKNAMKGDDKTKESSPGPLKRSLPSKGKDQAWGENQSSTDAGSLKRSLQSKGKGRDESQYQESSSPQKDPVQKDESGSKSPFYMDTESENDEHKNSLRLTDPNCPAKSEDCSKPTCQTSVPGSYIPEGDKPDSGDGSDNEFVPAQSELGRTDDPGRRPSGKLNNKSTDAKNRSATATESSAVAGPSEQRERNIRKIWKPFKQEGACVEKILDMYKDIRVAPTENGKSYGIRSGSRVICVGDTVVSSTPDDVFRLEMGEAFIVLQMYGDLWASCIKLSLTDPLSGLVVSKRRDVVFAANPTDIKFLPLCSLTLEANFGRYIRRQSNFDISLLPAPYNGQRVVPPVRNQSERVAKAVREGGSIAIPRWIFNQCQGNNKMPDVRLTIPRDDKDVAPYGHMEEAVPSARRPASSTDEPDRPWFDRHNLEDRLTLKNGRLFGVGRMKRTQSSADCDTVEQNTMSSGRANPPSRTGTTGRTRTDNNPNRERVATDTVRSSGTEPAFSGPSSSGTHSPHQSTSQMASSLPNPPEALAGPSDMTEVRDFAQYSATLVNDTPARVNPSSRVFSGTGEGNAIPSSNAGENIVSSDTGAGYDAAPDSPNPSGFPSTVVRSSAAHKEAFSTTDQGSSAIGNQPYVTEGEIPASQVSVHRQRPVPVRTESQKEEEAAAQRVRSGRKLSSMALDRWTRLSQVWRNKGANRRTQSDFNP